MITSSMRTIRRRTPPWVYFSDDFTGGELVTHAESCVRLVGYSKLGEALLAGKDVHSVLGAQMLGVSYDEFMAMRRGERGPEKKKVADAFRQSAKPVNFGCPGRMGAARMVAQQLNADEDTPWPDGPHDLDGAGKMGYIGIRFCLLIGGAKRCGATKVHEWNRQSLPAPLCLGCLESAEWLKKEWQGAYPENVPYLKQVVPAAEDRGYVIQHYSNRKRGLHPGQDGGSFANGYFQAFLADITTRAYIRVSRECYVRSTVVETEWPSAYAGQVSPLFGQTGCVARAPVFAHDEIFGEMREDVFPDAIERVDEIMIEEFKRGCPRHAGACKASPAGMRRWYKGAAERRRCGACGKVFDERKDCPACGTRGRMIVWEPAPEKAAA